MIRIIKKYTVACHFILVSENAEEIGMKINHHSFEGGTIDLKWLIG